MSVNKTSLAKKAFFVAIASASLLSCTVFDKRSSSSSAAGSSSLADSSSSSASGDVSSSVSDDAAPITFNFIEQGNSHSGDVTYIKAGDNDILIDSGSAKDVAKTAAAYMDDSKRQDDYVKDGKLEYVIATHAHEDHIAGFVGSVDSSAPGGRTGLLYHYAVDTIIDFPQTDATTVIYSDYQLARTYAMNAGAKHYTALQCWNGADGASKTYTLGKNLTMTILYNFYYDHTPGESSTLDRTFTKSGFSKENDYSVCVLFTQGKKNFLFTGDAEAYAEYSLVKYNALPEVELFKAGHHGSPTASTQKLLDVIKPKMVCICACAGNTEYGQTSDATTFPGQDAIDRIAPYTDRVYVTTLGSYTDKSAHEPFNGNIIVDYDASGVETLECSNNDAKLKDSDWFKAHRTTPAAWA